MVSSRTTWREEQQVHHRCPFPPATVSLPVVGVTWVHQLDMSSNTTERFPTTTPSNSKHRKQPRTSSISSLAHFFSFSTTRNIISWVKKWAVCLKLLSTSIVWTQLSPTRRLWPCSSSALLKWRKTLWVFMFSSQLLKGSLYYSAAVSPCGPTVAWGQPCIRLVAPGYLRCYQPAIATFALWEVPFIRTCRRISNASLCRCWPFFSDDRKERWDETQVNENILQRQ